MLMVSGCGKKSILWKRLVMIRDINTNIDIEHRQGMGLVSGTVRVPGL